MPVSPLSRGLASWNSKRLLRRRTNKNGLLTIVDNALRVARNVPSVRFYEHLSARASAAQYFMIKT